LVAPAFPAETGDDRLLDAFAYETYDKALRERVVMNGPFSRSIDLRTA
jgi:hypothetical protein